jgi:hypothetical protein
MPPESEQTIAVRQAIESGFEAKMFDGPIVKGLFWDDELRGIQGAFSGKSWRDVTIEVVEAQWDNLPLLSAQATAYYIPAYMLASLEDPEGNHVLSTLLTLEHIQIFEGYTVQQCKAVVEFLRWIISERPEEYTSPSNLPGEDTDDLPARILIHQWLPRCPDGSDYLEGPPRVE